MRSRRNLVALVLMLTLAISLVGMFVSSGPKATARSPYQSALSSVGVATVEAARCPNRMCGRAFPGWVCTEGSQTKCVVGGGCTTVSRP